MNYVVAVSGGVDSVVLLDMLASRRLAAGTDASRRLQGEERFLEFTSKNLAEGQAPLMIVAHFDHGIRGESAADAEFVRALAAKYNLPFETKREELGKNASEERARERRYVFLREVAKKYDAKIVTAHHADDVVETIAINLTRGTGWRGLAVLDSPDIYRPLLGTAKKELVAYAKKHRLEWREDVTNRDTKYLRNDLRQRLEKLDAETRELLRRYRERQVFLRRAIDTESKVTSPYRRHLFITVPEPAALELLRAAVQRETGTSLTRPQLTRALHAVKVYHGGKTFPLGAHARLRFTKTHFTVEQMDANRPEVL